MCPGEERREERLDKEAKVEGLCVYVCGGGCVGIEGREDVRREREEHKEAKVEGLVDKEGSDRRGRGGKEGRQGSRR